MIVVIAVLAVVMAMTVPRLAGRQGRVLQLAADRQWEPLDRAVDVLVGRLRRKLGVDVIRTQRGLGYVLSADGDEDG